ncbi:hypothetical protein GHAL_3324 [Hafnia alvei ATCC 13337]|uniref:O-antigen polymerase n=1 Tax=Hafnia alvei ATCC 13337 TaxID=910996 RepID=A0ABD3ZE39_HAFAL|nr:hypothetical protein GHAL_3324 [Hafnia alvei ATCC 13337]
MLCIGGGLVGLSLGCISNVSSSSMSKVVNFVIFIMSVFIFIQIASHYFLGLNIDFSQMTGGGLSRSYYGEVYRPSGFLPEPAVFSGHMCALLALSLYYNKKLNFYFYFGTLAVLGTLSTVGIILCACLYISFIMSVKNNLFSYIIFFLFILLFSIFIFPSLADRYELFINGVDSSNNLKIDAIKNFFGDKDIFLYGYGVIGRDHPLLPPYFEAIKDVTIFGAIFSVYGVVLGAVVFLLFVVVFIKSSLSFRSKIILTIPLMKLCTPSYAFFFIYLAIYFLILNSKPSQFVK